MTLDLPQFWTAKEEAPKHEVKRRERTVATKALGCAHGEDPTPPQNGGVVAAERKKTIR